MIINSINLDGRFESLVKLLTELSKEGVDNRPGLILIQDHPRLDSKTKLAIKTLGYVIKPSSFNQKRMNTTMWISNKRLDGIQMETTTNDLIKVATVQRNTQKLAIINIYLKPSLDQKQIQETLDEIRKVAKKIGNSKMLLGGDFNSIDSNWSTTNELYPELSTLPEDLNAAGDGHYKQKRLTRGRQVFRLMRDLKLRILNSTNEGHSFESRTTGNKTLIDLIMVGEKASRIWKKATLIDIGLEHKLIQISGNGLEKEEDASKNDRKRVKTSFNIEAITKASVLELDIASFKMITNWHQLKYKTLVQRIEDLTTTIIKHLLIIQESVKRTRSSVAMKQLGTPREQRALAKTLKRFRKLTRKTKEIKRRGKRFGKEARNKKVKTSKEEIDAKRKQLGKLTKLKNQVLQIIERKTAIINRVPIDKEQDEDLWTKLKAIGNNLRGKLIEEAVINTQEDLEKLADEKFGLSDKLEATTSGSILAYHSEETNIIPPMEENEYLYIYPWETRQAIKRLRARKFAGPEGIKFEVLNKILGLSENIFHQWAAMCFKAAYIPRACRLTTGKLIPKAVPGKFRIVHIGSPLSALLEQIALRRLEYRLEQNLCNNKRQYGFTALKSRHDLVARVIELTLKHRLQQFGKIAPCTTIIGLDVRGAFDNVDQGILKAKLLEELAPDPVRYWLANFIHNRMIKIKCKGLISEARRIRLGVPQGSCLGPILWNLTINKLDKQITQVGETEALAYADDLIVVHNGREWNTLQERLDKLISGLEELKLEVEPNKCNFMRIAMRGKKAIEREAPNIKIYNQNIKQASSISILGVPINFKLKLDKLNDRHQKGIKRSAHILNLVSRLNIINTPEEWRILFDSYINSVTLANNLPMLASDKNARDWCNKLRLNAIKRTFDWPSNTSNKLVKLITQVEDVEVYTNKAINIRGCKEGGASFRFLSEVFKRGGIERIETCNGVRGIIQTIRDIEINKDKQADPEITNITEEDTIDLDQTNKTGPVWVSIKSTKQDPTICEYLAPNIILRSIYGRHVEHRAGYFATMGLIWELVKTKAITSKRLALSRDDPILMALMNELNHDWRVINLRKELIEEGWRVWIIKDNQQYKQVRQLIVNQQLQQQQQQHQKQLQQQGWQPTQSIGYFNGTNQASNNWNKHITPTWPPIKDYKTIQDIKKRASTAKYMDLTLSHTSMTRLLCKTALSWGKLTPNWLSGKSMLMLSAMFEDSNGQLKKGNLERMAADGNTSSENISNNTHQTNNLISGEASITTSMITLSTLNTSATTCCNNPTSNRSKNRSSSSSNNNDISNASTMNNNNNPMERKGEDGEEEAENNDKDEDNEDNNNKEDNNNNRDKGIIPDGCKRECVIFETDLINDKWQRQVVTHRAFRCGRFRKERGNLRRLINQAWQEKIRGHTKMLNEMEANKSWNAPWDKEEMIKSIVENRRLAQPFIRILTSLAFNNN